MKNYLALGFLAVMMLLASGCGGSTTGSSARSGEITPEEQAAIDSHDRAVEEAEKAHSSGK